MVTVKVEPSLIFPLPVAGALFVCTKAPPI